MLFKMPKNSRGCVQREKAILPIYKRNPKILSHIQVLRFRRKMRYVSKITKKEKAHVDRSDPKNRAIYPNETNKKRNRRTDRRTDRRTAKRTAKRTVKGSRSAQEDRSTHPNETN